MDLDAGEARLWLVGGGAMGVALSSRRRVMGKGGAARARKGLLQTGYGGRRGVQGCRRWISEVVERDLSMGDGRGKWWMEMARLDCYHVVLLA